MSNKHPANPPLSPLTMAILLALADAERHGYALMKEVEEQTKGLLKPGTGSLYAALDRLIDDGMIEEAPHVARPGDDPRRKHFRITAAGRAATRAEATRMLDVLEIASSKALAPGFISGSRDRS